MSATNEPASNSAFDVRFFSPGDEEGILRVLQASFPRWPEVETDVPPIDHLRWKLANVPNPDATHIVADAGGEIIGCRISLVQRVRHHGELQYARTDIDNAVAPEWRGMGVNGAITQYIVDVSKADIIMTSTLVETIRRVDASLGHRRIRNRLSMIRCDLSATGAPQPLASGGVTEVEGFDERIDEFLLRASAPFDLIAAPTVDRLNWRYADKRGGNGFMLQAETSGEVTGIIVARISRGVGYIAYSIALPDRDALVRALVAECLVRLHDMGVTDVRCALPEHHPYRPLLAELGFIHKGNRVPFTARPRIGAPELTFLGKQAAIHWMLGDTDLI